MKKVLLHVFLVLLALTAQARDVSFNGVRAAVIIDVRTQEEFAAGHIDGAVNIPFDEIGTGIHSLRNLTKDSTILVYCRTGRRSAIARATLEQQGYKRILDGGGIESLAPRLKICSSRTC